MALFGSDRPVMPSFRTAPELDSSASSPYDDLNRIERNVERNLERTTERNLGRNDRNLERIPERHGRDDRDLERHIERNGDRNGREERGRDDRNVERDAPAPAPAKVAVQSSPRSDGRRSPSLGHPLLEGLFDKLPEPETEWSMQARQKWLQTAANIFDLMYTPNEADAGELTVRVERTAAR